MAFTRSWDESLPDGAVTAAADIDLEFRKLKEDIRERLDDISTFGSDQDPAVLKGATPRARVTGSAGTQAIPSGSWTPITWDTVTFEDGDLVDLGTNDDRLKVPTDGNGVYIVHGLVSWSSGTATTGTALGTRIRSNDAVDEAKVIDFAEAGQDVSQSVFAVLILADADFIRLEVFQNEGSDLNIDQANTHFSAVRLGTT